MERELEALYQQAHLLTRALPSVRFGPERIRNSIPYVQSIVTDAEATMSDFPASWDPKLFSQAERAEILGQTCLRVTSLLFSAGAETASWREWCALSGQLIRLARDPATAMQLLTIARILPDDERLIPLVHERLPARRAQIIQEIIFGSPTVDLSSSAASDDPTAAYEGLLRKLRANQLSGVTQEIARIVEFWLAETQYGEFEPGAYPVFEPEVNAVVSCLSMRGVRLAFGETVHQFLRAALE